MNAEGSELFIFINPSSASVRSCNTINNFSLFWDPEVDGEMVDMPLAPQLITEMSPGGDPDDLSEFIGPELATLVSTTQDKSIPIIQNPDMNTLY